MSDHAPSNIPVTTAMTPPLLTDERHEFSDELIRKTSEVLIQTDSTDGLTVCLMDVGAMLRDYLHLKEERTTQASRHEVLYTLAVGYERAERSRRDWMGVPDAWPSPAEDEEAPSLEWSAEYDKRAKEAHRLRALYRSALDMAIETEAALPTLKEGEQPL